MWNELLKDLFYNGRSLSDLIGQITWQFEAGEVVNYAALLTMALVCIYLGAHLALKNKSSLDTMPSNYAWKVPFIASGSLFALYICFRYFKDYINVLLTIYFSVTGITTMCTCFDPLFKKIYHILGGHEERLSKWQFSLPYFFSRGIQFTSLDLLNLVFALLLTTWYLISKHWIANNVLGILFSISVISLVSFGKYSVGCIVLSGLFLYDIFWVFGTNVMVTVAKSLDAPIKLLFPRNIWANEYLFSMLGLGDIIIPGWFLGLLLRYDISRKKAQSKSTPYFTITFIAYAIGLSVTMLIMHLFKSPQPALLYLVPACLSSSLMTALFLGDLKGLLAYQEGAITVDALEEPLKAHQD